MTDDREAAARSELRRPDGRPRPLDYERMLPFAAPERLGWRDVAVIVFILLGPILLWIVGRVIGFR